MSDETTVKEPRGITDCGKDDCTPIEHWQRIALDAIRRKDEARSAVLAEVRAAVEGLPGVGGILLDRERVLALIDHISEGK